MTTRITHRRGLLAALAGTALACAAAAATTAFAAQEPDAAALLARADEYRNFRGKPFSFGLEIVSHEDDAPVRSFRLSARVRDAHTLLVVYEQPASEQGKAMLMDGSNLWFSTPSNSKPIRITPAQRLLGEASNGDVASTDFSGDYDAASAAREAVDGTQAVRLELTPKPGGLAAYGRVLLWVRAGDAQPLKADFYGPSGKMLKTAHYRRFELLPASLGGKRQITEVEIVNALRSGHRTVMRYSDFKLEALPASMFTTAYLAKLR